jgi:hypothetical protein
MPSDAGSARCGWAADRLAQSRRTAARSASPSNLGAEAVLNYDARFSSSLTRRARSSMRSSVGDRCSMATFTPRPDDDELLSQIL